MRYPGDFVKLAEERSRKDRALRAIDVARPYAGKGLGGALTGLWTGISANKLRRMVAATPGVAIPSQRGLPIALAVIGAALGIGDEKLRQLSRQAKYKTVLKETRREA